MEVEMKTVDFEQMVADDAARQELHLLDLLRMLARRRRWIALCTAGLTLLTLIVCLLIPSRYTAETVVMPPVENSSMSSALLGQLSGSSALASAAGMSLGIKNPGEIYVSLLNSRTVVDAVIARFGLMDRYGKKRLSDARKAFARCSAVTLGARDGLITVSVTDRDPAEAAAIANGYIDEFRKFSAGMAITEASRRRAFFEHQLLEAKQKLAEAEEAMKGTEQSTGVLQIDSQTRALIESAADLRAQVVAKQVELQGMRTYATDDNPEVIEDRQQLAELQAQLAKLGGSGGDTASGLIVPKDKVPEAGIEYVRRMRDVKYYDTVSDLIARQYEIAKLDEARQGAAIQVVDLAVPPDKRSFPKLPLSVAVAAAVGLFASCLWVLAAEAFERLKRNPDELRRLDALRETLR